MAYDLRSIIEQALSNWKMQRPGFLSPNASTNRGRTVLDDPGAPPQFMRRLPQFNDQSMQVPTQAPLPQGLPEQPIGQLIPGITSQTQSGPLPVASMIGQTSPGTPMAQNIAPIGQTVRSASGSRTMGPTSNKGAGGV